MYNNIHWARTNFSDVPIIIGEFGVGTSQAKTAARWTYYDFVVNSAWESNTTVVLWEASGMFAPNSTTLYPDPTSLDIIVKAARGMHASFWSSAQLLQKMGEPVRDTGLPFVWHGKKPTSIGCSDGACAATLREGPHQRRPPMIILRLRLMSATSPSRKSLMAAIFPNDARPGKRAEVVLRLGGTSADLQIPAYL